MPPRSRSSTLRNDGRQTSPSGRTAASTSVRAAGRGRSAPEVARRATNGRRAPPSVRPATSSRVRATARDVRRPKSHDVPPRSQSGTRCDDGWRASPPGRPAASFRARPAGLDARQPKSHGVPPRSQRIAVRHPTHDLSCPCPQSRQHSKSTYECVNDLATDYAKLPTSRHDGTPRGGVVSCMPCSATPAASLYKTWKKKPK